jgi:hypothetical protein
LKILAWLKRPGKSLHSQLFHRQQRRETSFWILSFQHGLNQRDINRCWKPIIGRKASFRRICCHGMLNDASLWPPWIEYNLVNFRVNYIPIIKEP